MSVTEIEAQAERAEGLHVVMSPSVPVKTPLTLLPFSVLYRSPLGVLGQNGSSSWLIGSCRLAPGQRSMTSESETSSPASSSSVTMSSSCILMLPPFFSFHACRAPTPRDCLLIHSIGSGPSQPSHSTLNFHFPFTILDLRTSTSKYSVLPEVELVLGVAVLLEVELALGVAVLTSSRLRFFVGGAVSDTSTALSFVASACAWASLMERFKAPATSSSSDASTWAWAWATSASSLSSAASTEATGVVLPDADKLAAGVVGVGGGPGATGSSSASASTSSVGMGAAVAASSLIRASCSCASRPPGPSTSAPMLRRRSAKRLTSDFNSLSSSLPLRSALASLKSSQHHWRCRSLAMMEKRIASSTCVRQTWQDS